MDRRGRIPCHVVATDVLDGTEVMIAPGPLTTALLASAALPATFPSVAHSGRRLMDGAGAFALHALNLLVMRQLLSDIEHFSSRVELIVVPPLCPVTASAYVAS